MPDDSLLAGRTVAPSKLNNGTGRNSSGLSTDLVKIYKVCEFSIPSTFTIVSVSSATHAPSPG
jgi:hypothetical protein